MNTSANTKTTSRKNLASKTLLAIAVFAFGCADQKYPEDSLVLCSSHLLPVGSISINPNDGSTRFIETVGTISICNTSTNFPCIEFPIDFNIHSGIESVQLSIPEVSIQSTPSTLQWSSEQFHFSARRKNTRQWIVSATNEDVETIYQYSIETGFTHLTIKRKEPKSETKWHRCSGQMFFSDLNLRPSKNEDKFD